MTTKFTDLNLIRINVNKVDSYDTTQYINNIIFYACTNDRVDIINLLMECHRGWSWMSTMVIMSMSRMILHPNIFSYLSNDLQLYILEFLYDPPKIDWNISFLDHSLIMVALHHHSEATALLLATNARKYNININVCDSDNCMSVLQYCCMLSGTKTNFLIMKELLAAGADPYYLDIDKDTVLHYAMKGRSHEVLAYLLENFQFNINQGNWMGMAPLTQAYIHAMTTCPLDFNTIELLLQHGACINVRDPYSAITPIIYAIMDVRQRKCSRGCDACLPTSIPLQLPGLFRQELITSPFCSQCKQYVNSMCVINHMLRHNASVTVMDHMNINALMYGCIVDVSNGMSHITEMLLHQLVSSTITSVELITFLNHQDHNGNTAIMHACMSKFVINERSFPCIKTLIQAGADPFFVNNDGKDALSILIDRLNGFQTVEMKKDTIACIEYLNTMMNK